MFEIRRRQPRTLLEYQYGEACLGEFACDDAARSPRPDHNEIHGFVGFESSDGHAGFAG
jgi:hypothetical protein